MQKPARVLIKVSGEMLGGESGQGVNHEALEFFASEIKSVLEAGIEVGVVVGGGNIFRGLPAASSWNIDQASADYMGMLATVINALALQAVFESKLKVQSRVLSALSIQQVTETYIRRKANKHFQKNRVVIFAAGTGSPFFTTDTAASLRAREMGADLLIKATKVDGIYSADPMRDPKAKRFEALTYDEVLKQGLNVMDATAFTMCREAKIPILIFKMEGRGCMLSAIQDRKRGTMVTLD